jgi:hypothetical protein
MNGAEFIRNCNAFDPDELARYENQHVAWSEDGRQILAHADTPEELFRILKEKGLASSEYVLAFIDLSISLGGDFSDAIMEGDNSEC